MKNKTLVLPRQPGLVWDILNAPPLLILMAAIVVAFINPLSVASADSFTDIFFTNSFRGSFEWFKKLDWIGLIVQAVISVFSLVGVCLITIRIMTSLLYLSAKGLWEEVHDMKLGESDKYDFGLIAMTQAWAKGKGGYTGLDAILGAVLILLPDVKRYSDFGEKSGNKFDSDINMTQYILKISLPTILAVFFLAMGFNGTLVKGLATTVDFMGSVADKAVSVNYSGFIDDLIATGTGYKFTFAATGTEKGDLQGDLAKDIYGRAVSKAKGASEAQLYAIGQKVEAQVNEIDNWIEKSTTQITEEVLTGVNNQEDRYYAYLGYDIIVNTSEKATGASADIPMADLVGVEGIDAESAGVKEHIHIFIKQTNSFDSSYFNVEDVAS